LATLAAMNSAISWKIPYSKVLLLSYVRKILVAKHNYTFEKRQKELAKKKKKEEKRLKKAGTDKTQPISEDDESSS